MKTEDKIAVMMASVDGAEIEHILKNERDIGQQWCRIDLPKWNWNNYKYRVAKPKVTCDCPTCDKELYDTCVGSTWTTGNYCSDRCAYIADVMWAFKAGSK